MQARTFAAVICIRFTLLQIIADQSDTLTCHRSLQICFMLFIRVSMRDHVSRCTDIFSALYKIYGHQFSAFPLCRMDTLRSPCCTSTLKKFALRTTMSFSLSLTHVSSPHSCNFPYLGLSTNASRAVLRLIPLTALAEHAPYRPRRLAAFIDSCQSACAAESGKSASRLTTRGRRFHSRRRSHSVMKYLLFE